MKKSENRNADWITRPLEDELGEALRAELLGWPGVQGRPMMGTLSFFRRRQMLGCYVSRILFKKGKEPPKWANRAGEPPFVWVRLRPGDAGRALERPGIHKASIPMRWVQIPLDSRRALEEAVRWLGCAMERPPRAGKTKGKKHEAKGKK